MTNKVTMPDPIGHISVTTGGVTVSYLTNKGARSVRSGDTLITTWQAEAYANQRVKQALEEAIIEVMRCKTSGIIRNDTVDKCADAIRALIPATK